MEFVEKKRRIFLGLPLTFTKYTITDEMITIRKGFLSIQEDDAYMYKVQDVRLTRTLFERLAGLSTVICYTGDITDETLVISHVRHGADIKNFILEASEEARRKRRTLHSMNIDYEDDHHDVD